MIQDIYNAVIEMEQELTEELVKKEIAAGTDISKILNEGLISAMDEVGRRFAEGEFFVPEMLQAAHAMKAGLDVLKPHMASGDSSNKGTIVIGTVKGDLHDIGKNLVSMMLEGAGFLVIDLGVDVDTDAFLTAAEKNKADIICMSALLTTTMPGMDALVKTVREKGLSYKTMVGGAPVTPAYARKIGADGYGEDAPGAVETARKLLNV
jgi:corrinoid protein of di/trimethylamine methyltransferase